MSEPYIQHSAKVVATDTNFTHVMAISLDPRTDYKRGVIRCITSREGDVAMSGYIDRSELHAIVGSSLEGFQIKERLRIRNEDEIIRGILKNGYEFIGLEDPDIWIDEEHDLLHLYFTMPMINMADHSRNQIHLGHAVGKNLDDLEMTAPVLLADAVGGAKELCVAPINSQGFRYNLVESSKKENDFTYSVVRTAVVKDMGKSWKFGEIAFHPMTHHIKWIGGHASPGPLFPQRFINVGEGKRLGVMNGREANTRHEGTIKYGIFSVGLFIYDYENGRIEWVSPEPFIRDSEARTITFASQFVLTKPGEGILYAHVDDSFVRAYTLNAAQVRLSLPEKYVYN